MGQTLTHGVYLPDEGERNCYSGLAANWQILDTSVGTIAEHTTQIAGKAPAVHTHNKSDITDFPVYGTTAGTICEGNDSRLSDARTPIAHTHGKADITDLFNSGNTWSGNQYYTGMVILNSSSDVVEQFRQNLPKDVSISSDALVRFNTLTDSAGHYVVIESEGHWDTYVAKSIALKYKNDSTKQGSIEFRLQSNGSGILYARSPFECDLGNAYNKWATLNGINPGALSLPDIGAYTDLTSNIPSASLNGSTEINLSSYITTKGWLAIVVPDTNTDDFVFCQNGSTLSNRYFMSGARGNGFISLMMPINNAGEVKVQIKASSVSFCRFYRCLGNV